MGTWTDNCREWLRNQGLHPAEMNLKPFVAAAVVSGIVFDELNQFPFGVNLGISLGSASRPSAAWRDVLRNGIPRPVPNENYLRPVERQTQMVRETVKF